MAELCAFANPTCVSKEADYRQMLHDARPDYDQDLVQFGLLLIADVEEHAAQAAARWLRRAPTWQLQAEREFRERELAFIKTLNLEGQTQRTALIAHHAAEAARCADAIAYRQTLPASYQSQAQFDGEFPRELKRLVDLRDFVLAWVSIARREGVYIQVLCPFHNEKTPSLTIWQDHWHCFGCGESGDVYDWLEKSGVTHDFAESIRHLADRMGIAIPTPKPLAQPRIVNPASRSQPIWERQAL